jgi:4'-phosphopantetheinyl transferase
LEADQVHIWRADLGVPEPEFDRLELTVSPGERIRASRFRLAEDGRRFLAGRAILRDVLARYCDLVPAELLFARGAHGKPMIASGGMDWLRINSSHSGKFVLVAVARDREVGVDVERIQPALVDSKIAGHFFAPGEMCALRKLNRQLRTAAFFACWTRKEAYVKARGDGLFSGLNDFEVTVAPNQPAELIRGDKSWSLRSLNIADGFASACAVEGSDWNLRLWNWQGSAGERAIIQSREAAA